MKQFIYAMMIVLAISVISCCKSDDNSIEISASSIMAKWDVTEMNDGTGWLRTDSSRVILSEDGYCLITGRLLSKANMGYGRYSFSGNTALLRSDDGITTVQCVFTDVRQHSATATLVLGNTKMDVKMKRDESEPLLYKEPVAFLQGIWKLIKSGKYDSDLVPDEDGSAVFEGDKVTFSIKNDVYTSTFRRYNVLIIATTDERFSLKSYERPDEIIVSFQRNLMIFKRQQTNDTDD